MKPRSTTYEGQQSISRSISIRERKRRMRDRSMLQRHQYVSEELYLSDSQLCTPKPHRTACCSDSTHRTTVSEGAHRCITSSLLGDIIQLAMRLSVALVFDIPGFSDAAKALYDRYVSGVGPRGVRPFCWFDGLSFQTGYKLPLHNSVLRGDTR
jgi:hypothetical protein